MGPLASFVAPTMAAAKVSPVNRPVMAPGSGSRVSGGVVMPGRVVVMTVSPCWVPCPDDSFVSAKQSSCCTGHGAGPGHVRPDQPPALPPAHALGAYEPRPALGVAAVGGAAGFGDV